ncbi:MAG: nucleoside hydrolase [Acidobacteria bacterium]|nr:nucleoside hydrolase [Acidobacteriota bacterium]
MTLQRTAFLLLVLAALPLQAEPVKIIFDTDMANDCDDAGALAVLNALADRGEAEILAVVTNRKDASNASAAAVDAINTWYGRPDVPIGTDKDGAKVDRGRPSSYAGALRDEFPHDARPDDAMPDAVEVYRKTLAAQPDGSVVLCSVGALSNLEDLLRSPADSSSPLPGRELVERKVRRMYLMGGGFPRTARPETNLLLDPAAVVTVVNEWPTPIVWQGYEVGAAILTGRELLPTPKANPVRRAYELRPYFDSFALQLSKPSHDLATVLLAVRGVDPKLWNEVSGGRVVSDSDGHTEWRSNRVAKHSYVVIRGNPDTLEGLLGELLAAPPARH